MIQGMRETVGLFFHEFSDLSVDATVNIMQSISGNVPEGKTGSRLPEQERCCLTAKGRTGSVLAIEPIRAEDFAELLRAGAAREGIAGRRVRLSGGTLSR